MPRRPRILAVGLLALCAGCASLEPSWELFPERDREEVWKILVTVVHERYDLAVLRPEERFLETEWKGLPAPLRDGRRRRVEARVEDDPVTGAPLLLVTAESQVNRGSGDSRSTVAADWTPDGRDTAEERRLIQCVKSALALEGPGPPEGKPARRPADLWKGRPSEPDEGDPWGDLASKRPGG